ncbi:hypothetical protein Sango_0405600 [Sesamum angolense]|uniref:Uncharacterized protein n=1 Tax=Sesamum angolense TaxID=2727404 RepID=A0AAE2C410_9LAMI|nr:hypothetical protein Sango_0405600 [Sesamum angolense]
MAGDFNRSPNSFNFDFGREATNSLLKLMERYLVPVNPSAERTKSAKREPHPDAFSSSSLTVQCLSKLGISSLEFDTKISSPDLKEDEAKQLLHISMYQQLDVVRWNLANKDEIACTSMKSSEVHVFDIGFISSEPVQLLRKRPNITVHGVNVHKGFSDIAFSSDDSSRRVSNFPCLELTTNSTDSLNSIKLSGDNEEYYSPLLKVKLAHELEKISPLKDLLSILFCFDSLPFLNMIIVVCSRSGVLDTTKFQVTHIHCPPPSWLDEQNDLANLSYLKKPCWLPINSIYAVGSSSNGLYLLDFYPDCTSPCHVDYNEDIHSTGEATSQHMQNRYLPLSESVTACVAHPLNGTIVAGTELSSLLVISQ